MRLQFLSRRIGATVLCGVIASSVAGIGAPAHAQPWLPDRAYTEGPGIRAGDLEIHPGIAVRGGYDRNVFLADGRKETGTINGQPVNLTQPVLGAGILSVTPHIHVSTLSLQRKTEGETRDNAEHAAPVVTFRGGAAATYYQYFMDNGPRNVGVDTDVELHILPTRPFNLDLSASYLRNVQPFTQNAGDRNAYNYHLFQPRLRLNFGSRSQVLTAYVGYAPRLMLFESRYFDYLNTTSHNIELGSAWRFLPNTAVLYDTQVDKLIYMNSALDSANSPLYFQDSLRFRTRVGLNGAITKSMTARALVGYALTHFNDSFLEDHEDVVGEASLAWNFGLARRSQFQVGYQRDLVASAMGGWIRSDRGSFMLSAYLGRVVLLSFEGGVSGLQYGRVLGIDPRTREVVPLGANQSTDRHDIRLDSALRGEVRLTNWLSLLAEVVGQAVITDFKYAVRYTDLVVPDPAQYWTVRAFGGIRAHY